MRLFATSIFLALALLTSGCEKASDAPQPKLDTLFLAAQYGDAKTIRDLVAKGHKIDEVDQHGRTPLVYAVMDHHMEAAKALISLGANKEIKTAKGYDLVMLSLYHAKDPSLDMLDYLIGLGLKVDNRTSDGDSALNIAISSHDEKAVAKLISLGAKPNEKSMEILNAQTNPNPAIVKLVTGKDK